MRDHFLQDIVDFTKCLHLYDYFNTCSSQKPRRKLSEKVNISVTVFDCNEIHCVLFTQVTPSGFSSLFNLHGNNHKQLLNFSWSGLYYHC